MNNTNKNTTTKTGNQEQAAVDADSTVKAKQIKLGIDVHLDRYVVVRIIDSGTPQPPQRFQPVEFMLWVAKQLMLAGKVFTCYEAGPFGYSLHRKLERMGATNYVVRPRDWDEYGQRVKTDKRDAKQLALHLDRYVNGNRDTFCVVRVPTPEQEQQRSASRQRESFQRERQACVTACFFVAALIGRKLWQGGICILVLAAAVLSWPLVTAIWGNHLPDIAVLTAIGVPLVAGAFAYVFALRPRIKGPYPAPVMHR